MSSVADTMGRVRVALVSPYSYTYPGGVGRHAEALAEELSEQGHEVSSWRHTTPMTAWPV